MFAGLSRENRSYLKWPPGPILTAKNGPPGSHLLAKMVPWPKLVLAGPNLATKIGPQDHIWQPKVVPQTSLGGYEWSYFPILTAQKAEYMHASNKQKGHSYACF